MSEGGLSARWEHWIEGRFAATGRLVARPTAGPERCVERPYVRAHLAEPFTLTAHELEQLQRKLPLAGAAARGERRAGRVPGQGPGRAEPERRLRGRAARGVPAQVLKFWRRAGMASGYASTRPDSGERSGSRLRPRHGAERACLEDLEGQACPRLTSMSICRRRPSRWSR